jgi:predicted Rossmann fold nucleotide-binding protein DprA/Smf involved in DNA uptake
MRCCYVFRLIFLRLGATLATHPLHLLEALQIPPIFTESTQTLLLEGNEKTVYDLLSAPTRRDKLVKASGLTVDDTLTALVTLELKGVAREEHGLWKRV